MAFPGPHEGGAPKQRSRSKYALWRRRAYWVWRGLISPKGWRTAGRVEYAFTTEWIGYVNGFAALRVAIAGLAMMMLPLAVVMQFNPMGPHGAFARTAQLTVAALGFLLGVEWLAGRWPTSWQATRFLLLSDVLIGIASATYSSAAARICSTTHLAMLGMFAAFFLGWRILTIHCVASLLLIVGLTAYASIVEGHSMMELYVYATPAVTTVVGLPVIIQVVVESGRRGIIRISREWDRDSLTELYSRRGMQLAVRRVLSDKSTTGGFFVMGMLDLDGFKTYNDTHGHFAGDELLQQVAAQLDRNLPRVLVARGGGDEFTMFAVREDRAAADSVVEAMRAQVAERGGTQQGRIAASLGIVVVPASEESKLREAATDADAALYEAKRSAVESVVVRYRLVDA